VDQVMKANAKRVSAYLVRLKAEALASGDIMTALFGVCHARPEVALSLSYYDPRHEVQTESELDDLVEHEVGRATRLQWYTAGLVIRGVPVAAALGTNYWLGPQSGPLAAVLLLRPIGSSTVTVITPRAMRSGKLSIAEALSALDRATRLCQNTN